MSKIAIFNNEVELGLRVAIILNTIYPKFTDVETINYLDYFGLHSFDFGGEVSLHSPVPNRTGELFVKRNLILRTLNFLIIKGLAEQKFTSNGVEYSASDYTTPFIDCLNEKYTLTYIERIDWVINKFGNYSLRDLSKYLGEKHDSMENDIQFYSIGLLNEK